MSCFVKAMVLHIKQTKLLSNQNLCLSLKKKLDKIDGTKGYSVVYWKINSMHQRQQNTLYPKGGIVCKNNFLKLLIGSQPAIGGMSLICGIYYKHIINLDSSRNSLRKTCHRWGKGYFAADGIINS